MLPRRSLPHGRDHFDPQRFVSMNLLLGSNAQRVITAFIVIYLWLRNAWVHILRLV